MLAVLNYDRYDRLPVVNFGFLRGTLDRWVLEGHITPQEADSADPGDGTPGEQRLSEKLGFDCNYHTAFMPSTRVEPPFERTVLEELPDGNRKVMTANGAVVLENDRCASIPMEVDHVLKGRKEWEEIFLPRLAYTEDRINSTLVHCPDRMLPFAEGGREYLASGRREHHYLLYCGNLYGVLRDYMGMENLCYLSADDPELLDEMIDVNAELCYQCFEGSLATGVTFDIAHFWEDICFKNGPLVNPAFFARKLGPHYRRITDLLSKHGINLVSLDCDGVIDSLLPVWFANGVNVMFPIEVGTWNASIKPWREEYGRELRGVGGMDKRVFARDYAAVEAEIERLKPLVDLGGYIPCPDHRLAPDAKWDNVRYYTESMRRAFGG